MSTLGHKRNSESLIPLKQFRRSVIDKQLTITDVSRKHRVRSVSGLLPDLPGRDPRRRRRRSQSRTQAMAGEFIRVQADGCDTLFDNKRYGLTGEASIKQVAVPVHGAVYRSVLYPRTL